MDMHKTSLRTARRIGVAAAFLIASCSLALAHHGGDFQGRGGHGGFGGGFHGGCGDDECCSGDQDDRMDAFTLGASEVLLMSDVSATSFDGRYAYSGPT
jgi:hypothetical protein